VPASAVIPAPIVYLNIAAVKKLVVTGGSRLGFTLGREELGRGSSAKALVRTALFHR